MAGVFGRLKPHTANNINLNSFNMDFVNPEVPLYGGKFHCILSYRVIILHIFSSELPIADIS